MFPPKTSGRSVCQRYPIGDVETLVRRAVGQRHEPPSRSRRLELPVTRAVRRYPGLVADFASRNLRDSAPLREGHYLTVLDAQYRQLLVTRQIRRIHDGPLIRGVVVEQQVHSTVVTRVTAYPQVVLKSTLFREEAESREKRPILRRRINNRRHKCLFSPWVDMKPIRKPRGRLI